MLNTSLLETLFGASLSLAGILLVFMGFLYSQAQSFPPDTTDDAIIQRYKQIAKLGLVPFVLAIIVAGLAFRQLTAASVTSSGLLLWGFWLELALLLAYGVVSVLFYLD